MNLRVSKLLLKTILMLVIVALPITAAADEIIIQDTNGTVRAQGDLENSPDGTVTMTVTDTASGDPAQDGTIVTLTPIGGGAAITGTVIGGEVIFAGLTAGVYTVASTSAITFTSVSVVAGSTALAGAGVAGGTGAALGGGAAAGAVGVAAVGAGAAIAIDQSNDSNNDDPMSPFQ